MLQLQAEKDAIKDDLTTKTTFIIWVFIILKLENVQSVCNLHKAYVRKNQKV